RPRWSPDGTHLAFVGRPADEGAELRVVTVDDGEVRTVATWSDDIDELAWSPDGSRLAFCARRRDPERYRHEKDRDRPPRKIERLLFRHDNEGWTADRRRHLFVVDAAGGEPAALSDGDFEDSGLAWSPDGREVVFASGRHDTWDTDYATDLFAVPAEGGDPR